MTTENVFVESLDVDVNGFTSLTETGELLCRIYYYQHANSSLTDCYPNVTKLHCNETPIALEEWPPKLHTSQMSRRRMELVMVYTYAPCDPNRKSSIEGI